MKFDWKYFHDEVCNFWVFVLTSNSEIRLIGRFADALAAKSFVDAMNSVDIREYMDMSYFMVDTSLPF